MAMFIIDEDIDLTPEELERIDDKGDSLQVTLSEPLTYTVNKIDGDRTVEALNIPKKIKGKHLKAMDNAEGEMSKSYCLLSKLTGIPVHAVEEMDGRDIMLCLGAAEPFLPRSRKTGKA
jgi:hypothetical protein